ncbi:MAG: hypothetical protein ACRDF9_07010 [Candidatus Limnocylindria bacterium]
MAVGAPNVAFLDLSEDVLPTRMAAHQVNDRSPLVGPMVELKHDRVGFAAIDTWMRQEVIPLLASRVKKGDICGRVI